MLGRALRRLAALIVTVLLGAQLVGVLSPASAGPGPIGQFGLPNIFKGAKDVAVKQALAAFGKSLGNQVPIVVSPEDAYPTTPDLGGAPFHPVVGAANLAGLLRDSRDGTVALAP